MNENQITGDDLAALMKIVPPATRSDCPGELYIGACERSLGEAFCRLRERGLVSVGLGPTSAPSRVIAFQAEFSPRTRLMADTVGRGATYGEIVSITDAGQAVVEKCGLSLPLPPWADAQCEMRGASDEQM